jgi:hypothetical protein
LEYGFDKKTLKEGKIKIKTVRLGQALFFIQLVFLITNQYWFPESPISWQLMITYMLIPMGFMIYSTRSEKIVQEVSLIRSIAWGVIAFWITYAIVLVFYGLILDMNFGTVAYPAIMSVVIAQMVFVAPSEELFFRLLLPDWLVSASPKKMWFIAVVISQMGFAMFHIAAYNGDLTGIIIAFFVGMIWYVTSKIPYHGKPIGIGATIGSHIAYNLIISGILVGNIAMVFGGT